MTRFSFFGIVIFALIFGSCSTTYLNYMVSRDLPTVQKVDIQRYSGKWYEIARLPNSFEKGLKCISATYTPGPNGKVDVLNQGRKISAPEKISSAKGYAKIPDPKYQGRLKVTFFWPFSGDYYILDLDPDYHYALVGDPSRKYLWVLCRNTKMDPVTFGRLMAKASDLGFDISQLIKVPHDCE